MTLSVVPIPNRKLARAGLDSLPSLIVRAGEQASWRFVEFFAANIRNKNTRQAYAHAVTQFFDWCDSRHLALADLRPAMVAAYIEQHASAAPTIKQHLAAIRMLFDWLVIGQVVPMNPAASVRGPKHVVKIGKTPVLKADQARQLLDSIDASKIVGLRDRAILGVMCYTFARVSATRCRRTTTQKRILTLTSTRPASATRNALPFSAPSTGTGRSRIGRSAGQTCCG